MKAEDITSQLSDMPGRYFDLTSSQERERHGQKLRGLTHESGLLIEPIQNPQGGWDVEIVTLDWEEPGLLDRIFEAILSSIHIPRGIVLKHVRIFTGLRRQVVNILEMTDRQGEPLGKEACEMVMERLRAIRHGERGVLESIEHTPFTTLIPLVTEFPLIDNSRSERYTFIDLRVANISNRFTSVLLHFLARSELWLNIQVAEFFQEEEGHYRFYVIDKYGHKLRDSHFTRLGLVRVLEEMNRMLMGFNVHYIRREWRMRIDRNERTIYHSRPHPEDLLEDLANVRQMARLKVFSYRLSSLVEQGLLDSRHFYFLKKAETFVEQNKEAIRSIVDTPLGEKEIELCRKYFDYRRRALRILMPLFDRLSTMPEIKPTLSDVQRLESLAKPTPSEPYALNERFELYNPSTLWQGDPATVLDPFVLLARTDCYFQQSLVDSMEASLEGWTPTFIQERRRELGSKFLQILDESVNQGNTPTVLRSMRQVGLLQRYLPGFQKIKGMVHVVADHAYTVDEHSFVVIEVLQGLKLLGDIMREPGSSMMREEFMGLKGEMGLKRFAAKYVMEMRILHRVTELRRNPTIKLFLLLMEDIRRNSLEFLMEMNFLEKGHATCMDALTEMEKVRGHLDPLMRTYSALPFSEQRILALVGLLHDLKKPARDHGPQTADALEEILDEIGLVLPPDQISRAAWLIRHHLDIRPLISRMGSEGEEALYSFSEEVGDRSLVRSLILFTYADRVAVYLDQNKNANDAMVLASMLNFLEE